MTSTRHLAAAALAAFSLALRAEAAARTPTAPSAEAPIYDPDAVGTQVIATYQKVAKDSGRRLLVNLGTNDCAPCRVVNHAIHEEKFYEAFLQQFVQADVDVSSGSNAMLLEAYHIDPRAEQPALVILMPDGRIIETLAHGEMALVAKKGDEAVRAWFLVRFAKSDK